MKRREFLGSAATVAGLVMTPSGVLSSDAKSRVVQVFHADAVRPGRQVDQAIVAKMLRSGLRALAGEGQSIGKWVRPGDRVGLKINTLGRPLLFTHRELILALVEELKETGVSENNIIVWDRFENHMLEARFVMNNSDRGVRYVATESGGDGPARLDDNEPYQSAHDDPRDRHNGDTASRFSRIFTRECDKIINMPILKDHGQTGVTLCLKNLAFGITTNNNRFHGASHVGPFISDICARPLVKSKTVLHILDGLEGCFNNGPAPRHPGSFSTPRTIWLGFDPVAVDVVGRRVIEEQRRAGGLPSLAAMNKPVDYIEMAARKGVGECNLDRISLEKISAA
ncbi:MAG: DUF362 domain-containing protein [Acidobacteriota bacterium]